MTAEGAPLITVTVVICAYTTERWPDLVAAVLGLAAQTRPAVQTVLVVDHDDELLVRARRELHGVEVVPNTRRRGLSGARNTGVSHATGEVVAFLDDDAVPRPDWLERLAAPYADASVVAVGGHARPAWPDGGRPAHLTAELDWVVGCTYRGQPETASDVRNLIGCNMSFRRDVLDVVGGFDEDAGRVGSLPLGCEETELCIRVGRQVPGSRIVLEPAAVVDHRVTPSRTTWSYLRRRSYAEGLSKAAMAGIVGGSAATSVERTYVTRVLTSGVRRELGRAVRGDAAGWSGAGGILTSLTVTVAGYARGRAGLGSRVREAATLARVAP